VFITQQNEVIPIMDQHAIASLTYIMVNVLAVFSKNIIHSLHCALTTSYEYMYYIAIYSLMAYLFYTLILITHTYDKILLQLENKVNMRHLTAVNDKSK
jgi:hypothetical protein